jgi:beta-glucosidase
MPLHSLASPRTNPFIEQLLARMTLEQKIGQFNHPNAFGGDTTGAGAAVDNIEQRIARGEVGFLAGGADAKQLRAWQEIAVQKSANGIPLIFTMDVIHGHRTIFPLPIGLAGSFDAELIRNTARVAAAEATAEGVSLTWAPMLDVSRDARWGRCAESPGEDPVLGSLYARAMVEGFQSDNPAQAQHLLSCAKHFAAYGFADGGRDYNAVDMTPYRLHNVVLPPFQAAVQAGVAAIMVGFHDLAGIPCTAHHELLNGVLRKAWGFEGLLVSDYTAIMELINHGVAANLEEAAYLAFTAGVDVDLISEAYRKHLPDLVRSGRVSMEAIDAACRRVLYAKWLLGLFDNPYRGLAGAPPVILAPAHRELARQAAAKSGVLLKNTGVLPLASNARVALIGPLAANRENLQGTWAVAARSADSVTVLEALQAAQRNVRYALGANLLDEPNLAARVNVFGPSFTVDSRSADALIADALALCAEVDVIVACVGEAKEHTGESSTRTDLTLPASQRRLLAALHATGKPLVLVTMSGRPLALEWEHHHAAAILHMWFGGSEAGSAIADLLYGVANPSARVTMSFPRDSGQCPLYYAESPTGRPRERIGVDVGGDSEVDAQGRHVFRKFTTACRLEGAHTALYPFGHGLSYTCFDYSELQLNKTQLRGTGDLLQVRVTLRNNGKCAGTEIVQLYISDPIASRSRPLRELKDFRCVNLAVGEQCVVQFELSVASLQYFRASSLAQPEPVFEPGTFVVYVGGSSEAALSASFDWLD